MTARELKDRLARRHPATQKIGSKVVPGVWTVIEEWEEIDLLAFSSYKTPPTGAQRQADYPRVGYEVKVSRGDLRRELLRPGKRWRAVSMCHEFYFAVPPGLLSDAELAYDEPDWKPEDLQREPCPGGCRPVQALVSDPRAFGVRAGRHVIALQAWPQAPEDLISCTACGGRGYAAKSRVEREAPTLWIPKDVGLVEVGESCRVVRKSPVRAEPTPLSAQQLGDLVRWVSARPDPRHVGLVDGARGRRQRSRRR